jgi:uncharacterized protein YoxC
MEPVIFWNMILTVFLSIGGWFIRTVVTDLRRIEKQMYECQTDLNDRFVRRDDYKEDIRRMEHKLDQIFDMIGDMQRSKADK